MPKSSVNLASNGRALRKVAKTLREHGVVYRDIQIGRSDRRDATFAIVTLTNGQRVTGDLEMLSKSYTEFGASGVNVEDTFIAKCLMLHE